jgi:hypothetical protein
MMPTTANRDDWAAPLAALVAALRHITGAPEWDVPGIRAAIHRARNIAPPHQLAHAAIDFAIMRPDLTTPVMLEQDGPWWHTGATPGARVVQERCSKVGHEHELARCCRLCASEAKAGPGVTEVPAGVLAVSEAQAAINARGRAMVAAALHPKQQPDVRELAGGEREDDR